MDKQPLKMDKQPLKIAAVVGVVILALVGLAVGIRTASQAEGYTPSPGGKVDFVMPPPKNTGVNPSGNVPRMSPRDPRDTTSEMPMHRP